jgi:hypothetical protein
MNSIRALISSHGHGSGFLVEEDTVEAVEALKLII